MTYLSHKIKLKPNKEAKEYFIKVSGVARFAYNWALGKNIEEYKEGTSKYPSAFTMTKEWNVVRKQEFPWSYEVTKCAGQYAIWDLSKAFKRFFKKTSKFPRFKKRGKSKDSFYLEINSFSVKDKYLKISRIKNPIKMCEKVRFEGDIKSVTISRQANEWFASFLVKVPDTYTYPHTCDNQDVVGVDLGIKTLAILSNGTKVNNTKALNKNLRKLRKLHKSLSRKKKGSANSKKAAMLLAIAYQRVSNIRNYTLHNLTTMLVKSFKYIGIEDLNVEGMVKNRKLSRHLQDASFGELRRQIEYKSKLSGSNVIVADRFFPSSKTCSNCGSKYSNLKLSQRNWCCDLCGVTHDRDLNAAINLKNVALKFRETLNACGDFSSGQFIGETRIVEAGTIL